MASRCEILAALKGQEVRVPDLQTLLQEWPQYTNQHLERLKIDVDAKLEELIPAGKRLQQMKRGNIAHFAATWWPYAEYEPLKYLAYLSIWLFNWDDETDSNEFSNMADHFDAEQRFRQDTLAFMRQCLSLTPASDSEPSDSREGSGDSHASSSSSSSGSAAAEASPSSSSPSIVTSTEAPSTHGPSRNTLRPPPPKLERSASYRKFASRFAQHARRPSTSPAIGVKSATKDPKAEGSDEVESPQESGKQVDHKPLSSAPGGKSRRTAIKKLASTIAKYFRPRKDSGVDMSCPVIAVAEGSEQEAVTTSPSRSPLISSFETIAEGVCPHLSPFEHQVFLRECEKFVNATESEQKLRVRGVLPDLEEYTAMRLDTGAVAMCLALHEYALGVQVPDSIRTDPDMVEIWLQANNIIWMVNDMLSIKKEIAQGETDSLLPILIGQGKGLQAAMDHAYGMTQSAKWALDAAALRLAEKVSASYDERVCEDVKKFVDSCRMACTGSTNWSVESGRYKIGVSSLAGGVVICLE